jgi:hypothetical protein
MKYPGRNLVEHYFFVLYIQGMTRIGTSLETGYKIILAGKKINDFTLSLIAPLEAKNYINHNLSDKCRLPTRKITGSQGHSGLKKEAVSKCLLRQPPERN